MAHQGPGRAGLNEALTRKREQQLRDPDLQRRRIGVRSPTNFPIAAYDGRAVIHSRAVELSSTGVVIERGRELTANDEGALLRLQLFLPDRSNPVRALARPVRRVGTRQALTFVAISDADRLTLVEHIDGEKRKLERVFRNLEL